MTYLHWDEKTITDFSSETISEMYSRGYVFTRIGKGVMHQTRSVRIDLSTFNLSSENRRILKKIFDIELKAEPLPYIAYDWSVAKLAKDFYSVKFGHGLKTIMSAAKIKEMLTNTSKSHWNTLLIYTQKGQPIGYTISYANADILHYSYPFYELDVSPKEMGMGMMVRAIQHAKESGMKYIYLGSLQRPGDVYKLQFEGLEWFDGKEWKTDMEEAKKILVLP